MAPRSVSSTPAFSRPYPCVRGANPIAESSLSASSTFCWPPEETVTRTPEPVSSTDSTFVEVSTLMPSFL